MSTRIKDYGFIKNFDYFKPNSGLKVKEVKYELTLDMAKEMAMLEGNDVGRMVRKYFIEFEKNARQFMLTTNPFKGLEPIIRNGVEMYPFSQVRAKLGLKPSGTISKLAKRFETEFSEEPYGFGQTVWYASKRQCLIVAFRRTANNLYQESKEQQKEYVANQPSLFNEQTEGGNQ